MKFKRGEIYHFTVKGSGTFPIDMLRYDAAWPADEQESPKIEQHPYSEPKPMREVVLSAVYTGSAHHPCVDRWRSFTWEVVDCETWNTSDRLTAAVYGRRV